MALRETLSRFRGKEQNADTPESEGLRVSHGALMAGDFRLEYERSIELKTRPDGRAGMYCDCEGVDLSSLSLANVGL